MRRDFLQTQPRGWAERLQDAAVVATSSVRLRESWNTFTSASLKSQPSSLSLLYPIRAVIGAIQTWILISKMTPSLTLASSPLLMLNKNKLLYICTTFCKLKYALSIWQISFHLSTTLGRQIVQIGKCHPNMWLACPRPKSLSVQWYFNCHLTLLLKAF